MRILNDAKFDRAAQDVGNIVALEHVNVTVPDQSIATAFYVQGLGFTRDPYLMVGLENMWINLGQEQFHLPTRHPQVLRGHVGVVVPDLDALTARLGAVRDRLARTAFAYTVEDKHVAVTCPWGNRLRCHAPGPQFGDTTLGMAYVEFPVKPGTAEGIARFYARVMGAPASVTPNGAPTARVRVGGRQELIFRETTAEIPPYDGHHIAVYVADFSGPHARLRERGLITEESNEVQYRFQDIADPDSGRVLFTIEHEVRSATHPMYLRPLVNRNPAQRQATYQRGRDAFVPGMV
jgi:catechol 2,3-dioxygenase-like lactoylglutathione lyase family enzyme